MMSRKISLLFIILALCASNVVVQAANWQRFSPSGGKLTITFPGVPKTTIKKKNVSENVFNRHVYMFTKEDEITKKKNAAFLLQYYDFSEKHRKTRTNREWLSSLQKVISNKSNIEVIGKVTTRVSGYLARKIVLKDGKKFIHLLFLLAKNRMYNVVVRTEEEKSRDAKRFINSFRILK